jgi:hypothetical protein
MIMLACGVCGLTYSFNAIHMGVIKNDAIAAADPSETKEAASG